MPLHRAYSSLHVKDLNEERRSFSGMATTPQVDRQGDIVEPLGVQYKNPLPLLLFHDSRLPVGEVTFGKPTKDGVPFTAIIPQVEEAGPLKDRVDEAWQSVKYRLIRGVSIGFREFKDAIEPIKDGGWRFLRSEVLELSLVPIPANAAATISTFKAYEFGPAATGTTTELEITHRPGVSGTPLAEARKGARPMTTQEQITSFEATRQAKAARMASLMSSAAESGSTLDAEQEQEYDTLETEVKSIDAHLKRLAVQEQLNVQSAKAVTSTAPSGVVVPSRQVTVTSQLPKGTSFVRSVMAVAACNGNKWEAAEYARERWGNTTPEVATFLKSAIAAGSTTDSTFAAPLAVANPLAGEFIELLRPRTLLGRIPNLRRVPFNVSVPTQTAGGTYGWVGQGKPKPLTNLATATTTLTINKIAGIIVLTQELVKISSPSAEALVREEMIAGIVKFMDEQFIDPAVAASGTVTPASITNGTTPVTSAGTSNDNARTDLKALMASFVAANLSTANAVWIMSEANAFALATAVNALGQPLFPGMTADGGTLFGRPVIATQSAGTTVALVDAQGILVADDGGVQIDVSREASLQMDSAPTDPPDASTVFVSMFQSNMIALRAERFVTWKRARTASVKYVAQSYV